MKHCFTHWPWEGTAGSVRSCGLYLDFAATTPKISECEEKTPHTFYHTFLTMMAGEAHLCSGCRRVAETAFMINHYS